MWSTGDRSVCGDVCVVSPNSKSLTKKCRLEIAVRSLISVDMTDVVSLLVAVVVVGCLVGLDGGGCPESCVC